MGTNGQADDILGKLAEKRVSAFEIGMALDCLEARGDNGRVSFLKQANIRGLGKSRAFIFLRFYRLYKNQPLEQMQQVTDFQAFVLGTELLDHYRRLNKFYPSPFLLRERADRALSLALQGCNGQSLRAALRWNGIDIGYFRNERGIENWLEKEGTFLEQQKIEILERQSLIGPVVGKVDLLAYRMPNTVILLEIKDIATSDSIGQVLAQRMEFIEKTLPLFSNRWKRDIMQVESWLIGQAFEASAFYAARGQNISIFKVWQNKTISGPLNALDMDRETWATVTGFST